MTTPMRRWLRTVATVVLAFLALLAVVISVGALTSTSRNTEAIRDSQINGTPLGQKIEQSTSDTADTLALLEDCLNPTGECGRRNARGQKEAIRKVRLDTIYAVSCADRPGIQTPRQIKVCVRAFRAKRNPDAP